VPSDSSRGTALPIEPQFNLEYSNINGKTASIAQKSRANSNPFDLEGSVRAGDPQRLPHAPKEMLSWTSKNGWLMDTDDFASRLSADEEVLGGDDKHHVWFANIDPLRKYLPHELKPVTLRQ
jgi:hypothetical protein